MELNAEQRHTNKTYTCSNRLKTHKLFTYVNLTSHFTLGIQFSNRFGLQTESAMQPLTREPSVPSGGGAYAKNIGFDR